VRRRARRLTFTASTLAVIGGVVVVVLTVTSGPLDGATRRPATLTEATGTPRPTSAAEPPFALPQGLRPSSPVAKAMRASGALYREPGWELEVAATGGIVSRGAYAGSTFNISSFARGHIHAPQGVFTYVRTSDGSYRHPGPCHIGDK